MTRRLLPHQRSRWLTRTLRERFDEKWMPEPNTGCWLWMGAAHPRGYGSMSFRGRQIAAHRVAWVLAGRELVKGLELDHICRTPACVNPDHLRQVTHRENILGNSDCPPARYARRTACSTCGGPYDSRHISGRIPARICRSCQRIDARSRYYQQRGLPVPVMRSQRTREKADRVHKLRAQGMNDRQIAELFGCAEQSVNYLRHRFGPNQ